MVVSQPAITGSGGAAEHVEHVNVNHVNNWTHFPLPVMHFPRREPTRAFLMFLSYRISLPALSEGGVSVA